MPEMKSSATFYMRELPKEHLIGYDTPEGKRLFSKALNEGGLESFFPLSQQFLTQNEPAYCGIGTLCMILNALKVDPTVTWKEPWRWYTQEMLDCCQPLEVVKREGITLAEFSCLAKCNGLEATTHFADKSTFEEFHEAVKACTYSSDKLMAVSYSRRSLGQTGAGHFSPVGGYSYERGGMVLILDVARFKYPSYWVPIKLLWEALIPNDPATNQPRGYSILCRRRTDLFGPNPHSLLRLDATKSTWPTISAPLYAAAKSAPTYDSLLQSLTDVLAPTSSPPPISAPTTTTAAGVAITTPVSSRATDAAINNPPISSPSSAPIQCDGIPFAQTNTVESKRDYERHLAAFQTHLSERCNIFQRLPHNCPKMELSVFLLALFSMQSFLSRLRPSVKTAVLEAIGGDLDDERIVREVTIVRRQMESVEKCFLEERKCTCLRAKD